MKSLTYNIFFYVGIALLILGLLDLQLSKFGYYSYTSMLGLILMMFGYLGIEINKNGGVQK